MLGGIVDLNSKSDLRWPSGFERSAGSSAEGGQSQSDKREMLQSRAWAIAISPTSNVFMLFLMFYFVGSGVSIYTFIMIVQFIKGPISALMSVGTRFKDFEKEVPQIGFYKLVYFLLNLGIFGFILYKIMGMGLLPIAPADYVDILPLNPVQTQVPFTVIK